MMSNKKLDDTHSDFCIRGFHTACKWSGCQCECHTKDEQIKPVTQESYRESYQKAFSKDTSGDSND